MSETVRRVIKWTAYPIFALGVFLVFVYLSLPYDKIKTRIEDYAGASGEMELTIGELGPRPLLGVSAERLVLVLKGSPTLALGEKERPKPLRVSFDSAVIKSGLLALIRGGVDVYVAASGLGGEIEASYESDTIKGWSVKGELSKVNLDRLPDLSSVLGPAFGGILASAKGPLSVKLDLSVPQHRWSAASGTIELECDGCSIGDGKTTVKIPGNPLLAMGITLPKLRLGRLGGQIKIDKGRATLENISAVSPDLEATMEGGVSLRDPVAYSSTEAYIRFKISAELKKREPKFELLENGMTNARRADGFLGLLLNGPLRSLTPVPSPLGPARGGMPGGPGGPGHVPRQFRSFPVQGAVPAAPPARRRSS